MLSLDPFSGALGEKKAAHLLRRATFGPTPEDIKQFALMTVSQAMSSLFTVQPLPDPPVDPDTGTTWLNPKNTNGDKNDLLIDYFIAWHLDQMRISGNNIRERIVYFLHTHLPTRRSIVESSESMYYQNAFFRYYAFDSYKDLFKKICIDNAMLVYIDGRLNINQSPNENFAREMFELYSIGKGLQVGDGDYTNYNEQDIKEAARVLSGYTNDTGFINKDTDTNIPIGVILPDNTSLDATLHDPGKKTFSAAFQDKTIEPSALNGGYATKIAAKAELDEMIEMIFSQDETARFLCRKLYRFFVYYDITTDVETQIIIPLAQTFKTSGYNLKTVISALLSSQHFYDFDNTETADNNIGAIIKSPVEIIMGSLRFFNVTFPATNTTGFYTDGYINGVTKLLLDQGLDFYEPYDVAGYDAYFQVPSYNRNWITPLNLANRYIFSQKLIENLNQGQSGSVIQADLIGFVDNTQHIADASSATQVVQAFVDYMLAVEVNTDRFNYFLNTIFLESLGAYNWTTEWNAYKAGGSNVTVKLRLETLVSKLIQTPEFQLF
jgi:uncharacterized protein (DUF1800 family)